MRKNDIFAAIIGTNMGSWTIYSKNGVAKAIVKELELHDEWMAECYLTVTVNNATPIRFAVGDYIDYRNERYTIEYDPNEIKKSTSGTYGEGFVYDGVRFVGSQDEIVRCDFNDVVLSDNNVHYTALPTFPFYCESVDDLLDRIQANLEELYPNQWIVIGLNTVRNSQRGSTVGRQTAFENAYKQWVDPDLTPNTEPYGKQSVAESADNITCWDALTKVHDDFGLNFIIRGKVIIVGTVGVFTSNTFRYGKGNGLSNIKRVSDSSQQIVTRLRAYGSETNLPLHYYSTLNKRVYATITNLKNKFGTHGADFLLDLDFADKYFTYQSGSYPKSGNYANYIVTISANGYSVRGYITKDYYSNACYMYCEYTGGFDDRDEPNEAAMSAFVTALSEGDRVDFIGYVKKDSFGDGHYDYATTSLPDNMCISRLMLPMFPNTSLYDWVKEHRDEGTDYDDATGRATYHGITAYFSKEAQRPYIDSLNKDIYGIRPSSIIFDGSNDTIDIHPTIEGMGVDEIVSADQIADNGVYDDSSVEVPNFYITLPNLGFDLAEVYEDNASIDIKDGMCGGRSFKIASIPTKDADGRWVCECERSRDENLNLFFPYEDFQITSGDHYVLTGIQMPDAYIEAASIRLLDAALNALQKNDAPRFTYQPEIDKIFMQRQHKSAVNHGDISLHDTLKAGDIFAFADTDMGIDANIIIDVLIIKENGDNGIPTYDITLNDEKQISPIQKIQNKIDSFFSSPINGTGGGGLTPHQIQSIVRKEGSDRYLSKVEDDTSKGNISFEKNINVGGRETVNDIQSTEYTGDGMLDTGYRLWYEEGRAKLVIDDLVARGKFTVNELETRIWTYAGGNMVFSGAGSTLFFVEYLDASDNPLGYTYINQPWLLRGRALLAGGLAWSKRKAIQRELTEAEKAQVVKFRCYEFSDDGTMQTRNWWKPNDIAMCETLNKVRSKANSDGSYSGSASNTVYKRRVAGIGSKQIPMLNDGRIYDYVDLWNIYDLAGNSCKYKGTDGQEHLIADSVKGYDSSYHDWPAAGDVIVQMGNPLDTERQAAVTIEVQGDVHGFKVYDTISDYSMANKLWVEIGYDQTIGKAKATIYGDCYIGARPSAGQDVGSTYLRFLRDADGQGNGLLEIKAVINLSSPLGSSGQTFSQFMTTLSNSLSDINNQLDKKAETWYQNSNPESIWYNPQATPPLDERSEHVGDMWYCTEDISGTSYKAGTTWYYQKGGTTQNPTYTWKQQNIPQSVFDTIDRKAAVYTTWNAWGTNLQVRDLYIPSADHTEGSGSSAKTYKKDKVYRCTNASIPTFEEINYTDDSNLNDFKANQYVIQLTNGTISSDVQDAKDSASSASSSASSAATSAASALTRAQNAESSASSASSSASSAASSASSAASSASQAASDAASAKSKADALDYVKNALNSDTEVSGGLMLTSLIALRQKSGNSYITTGGLQGYKGDGTAIGFWMGGGMTEQSAKIVFRHNGSGFMAGNKFSWDEYGNAKIGGFVIGADYIGQNSDISQQDTGYTYITRNGYINVKKASNGEALRVNGTANIYGSLYTQPSSAQYLNGAPLNLNVNANSGAYCYIGNSQSYLQVDASKSKFTYAVEMSSTLGVSGDVSFSGAVKTSSFTLPTSPSIGTVYFCKGTTNNMTVYATSPNKIMASDSRNEYSNINLSDSSAIFVYMATNKWVFFYCD